jgi:hypothetical protein
MEDTLSNLNAGSLKIRLTNEKLYINTSTSSETIALRSVNGIGVFDLVEQYNNALTEYKNKRNGPKFMIGCGIVPIILSFACLFDSLITGFIFLMIIGLAFSLIGKFMLDKTDEDEPILMSAVRIMMSGGNREFEFDKADINSNHIAEFVAKVESTLTAFHKNNG